MRQSSGRAEEDNGISSSIPSSLQMVHRYMIHVAAKVEKLHERTSVAKKEYLRQHRARGGSSADDPFERAAREEMLVNVAKEDIAAAEMVASRRTQPSTATQIGAQQQQQAAPTPTTTASPLALPQTGSLFGATSGGGLFGSAALPTPTPTLGGGGGSVFGGLGTSTTTAPAPFSLSTPAPTTVAPAFGTGTSSLFSPTPSPSPGGAALQPASPAPASPGLFGGGGLTTPAPTLAQPGLGSTFGAPAPAAGPKTRSKRSTRK